MDSSPPCTRSPPFASLKVFETIGRLGSIRKAALALNVDHAGVSRHLRELERWAGVPLMDRGRGEHGRLTVAGIGYHQRISAALREIDEAGADLLRSRDDTRLDVWCSHGFASQWLVPRLNRFTSTHGDIDLAVRPTESQPDLASPGCMVDIRFVGDWVSRAAFRGIETLQLFRPPVVLVASPSFLEAMSSVTRPEHLLQFPLLFAQDEAPWRTWLASQGLRNVRDLRGIRLSHAPLTIEAAKRGQGLALVNHFAVVDALNAGDLVEVPIGANPCPRSSIGSYCMHTREELWHSKVVKAFRTWIRNVVRGEDTNHRNR